MPLLRAAKSKYLRTNGISAGLFGIMFGCLLSLPAAAVPVLKGQAPISEPGAEPAGENDPMLHRVSVVGKDQRKLLPRMVENRYREAADSVGLIAHSNGFACTAFCVSADIIATNAHCVANRSVGRKPIDLNRSLFRLKPSHRYIHRLISRLRIGDEKQPLASVYTGVMSGNFSRATLHRDWALVKLVEPICDNYWVDLSDAPKQKISAAARTEKLYLIGYHGDKKMKGKWLSNTCSLVQGRRARALRISRTVSREHLLLHTCDATKGASGSPIFMETDDGPAVVGMNSGHVTYSTFRRNLRTGRRKLLSSRLANTGVRSTAFISGLDRFRSEEAVRSVNEMRRLQEHLRRAGLLRGRADGRFGPQTRRAIRRLEVRRKMAPLGLPTLTLLHDLDRAAAEKEAEAASRESKAGKKDLTENSAKRAAPPLPEQAERSPATVSRAVRSVQSEASKPK